VNKLIPNSFSRRRLRQEIMPRIGRNCKKNKAVASSFNTFEVTSDRVLPLLLFEAFIFKQNMTTVRFYF